MKQSFSYFFILFTAMAYEPSKSTSPILESPSMRNAISLTYWSFPEDNNLKIQDQPRKTTITSFEIRMTFHTTAAFCVKGN